MVALSIKMWDHSREGIAFYRGEHELSFSHFALWYLRSEVQAVSGYAGRESLKERIGLET